MPTKLASAGLGQLAAVMMLIGFYRRAELFTRRHAPSAAIVPPDLDLSQAFERPAPQARVA